MRCGVLKCVGVKRTAAPTQRLMAMSVCVISMSAAPSKGSCYHVVNSLHTMFGEDDVSREFLQTTGCPFSSLQKSLDKYMLVISMQHAVC